MRAACPVATAVRGSAARRACPAVQDWTGPLALAERLECRACRGLSGSLARWDLQVAAMLCPCSYLMFLPCAERAQWCHCLSPRTLAHISNTQDTGTQACPACGAAWGWLDFGEARGTPACLGLRESRGATALLEQQACRGYSAQWALPATGVERGSEGHLGSAL